MYPVSELYKAYILGANRRIHGRVTVSYTDPEIDPSVTVTANEENYISWPSQAADLELDVPFRWASLDGTWVLDGSSRLAPDTPAAAGRYPMGWWGSTAAGVGGAFSEPYPTLTVEFAARPVRSLLVQGDSAWGEYPVDFAVRLYDEDDVELLEVVVTDHDDVIWEQTLEEPETGVTRMELEITKWSADGRVVKIAEFYTTIEETYEGSALVSISLTEEREARSATIPTGNVVMNEIEIKLNNGDRKFDPDNVDSPLFGLLRANRRIRAWLGLELPDTSVEWVPLGRFYSVEWDAKEESVVATVRGRDRLERLRVREYLGGTVQENVSLADLAEDVLTDAGLGPGTYSIDSALDALVVPWGWLEIMKHRDAVQTIAAAALGVAEVDRDGVINVRIPTITPVELVSQMFMPFQTAEENPEEITSTDYFRVSTPYRQNEIANEVIAVAAPVAPGSSEEVYRSEEAITVPAGETVTEVIEYATTPITGALASLESAGADVTIQSVQYRAWGAIVTLENSGVTNQSAVVVVDGQPLVSQGKRRTTASDSEQQSIDGVISYTLPENHLIQRKATAQVAAAGVLSSRSLPRRDVDLQWRGNPAILLGDRVRVRDEDYIVIRQTLDWAGALSASLTGRRVIE